MRVLVHMYPDSNLTLVLYQGVWQDRTEARRQDLELLCHHVMEPRIEGPQKSEWRGRGIGGGAT